MENGQTYVIWLSEFRRSMSKLAILCKWACIVFKIVLAHLGLEILLKCIELALVSVEIIVVVLLGEMSKNFTWRIVEVSWSAVSIVSLTLISLFLGGSCRKLCFSLRSVLTSRGWFGERRSSWLSFGRSTILNYFGVDWLKKLDLYVLTFLLL